MVLISHCNYVRCNRGEKWWRGGQGLWETMAVISIQPRSCWNFGNCFEYPQKTQITLRPVAVWDWPTGPRYPLKFMLAAVICLTLPLKCYSQHRNLSGVEMCRKCRPGRETGLGEAYSAVLKCTLQRMVRSDCSEDVVTGAQPDSVANNKISNQSNNKGCHSLLRPLTSRAWKHLACMSWLMPIAVLCGGYDCPTIIINEEIGA